MNLDELFLKTGMVFWGVSGLSTLIYAVSGVVKNLNKLQGHWDVYQSKRNFKTNKRYENESKSNAVTVSDTINDAE